jgi:phosphatidylinositol 4-kinase
MIRANYALELYREHNNEFSFTQGIILPFFGSNPKSNLVVRILENECQCYSTKKRSPYRIVLETVDLNELVSFAVIKSHSSFSA